MGLRKDESLKIVPVCLDHSPHRARRVALAIHTLFYIAQCFPRQVGYVTMVKIVKDFVRGTCASTIPFV